MVVAVGLATKVFPYLELPKILQSDNSRKFVNEINIDIILWPGQVVIINEHPLVGKGNHFVEMQMQAQEMFHGLINIVNFLTHADNLNTP